MNVTIWWIRRDIRLQQNPALQEAILNSASILPLYILDPRLLAKKAEKRLSFLYDALHHLDLELKRGGSHLWIRSGDPLVVLKTVMAEINAEAIFAEADYTPYARQRDLRISRELPIWLIHGLTVYPPGVVVKNTGYPYTIFTPFSRAWKALPLPTISEQLPKSQVIPAPPVTQLTSETIPSFLGESDYPADEKVALARLEDFVSHKVYQYAATRDRLDLDGTSRLSPYIRFGLLSPQYVARKALAAIEYAPDEEARSSAESWLNELIWREFYISILNYFPEVLKGSFRKDLRNIRWREAPEDLQTWQDGMTGYPVVDAGMRQLKTTGWMHNRARMITASFLVKDLLINWQDGEAWFMRNLIDGDPATNNGGWQWTSGVGTDAAPYFRIFNPILQGEKFDPKGDYVRKWIPELSVVPDKFIHKPWQMSEAQQREIGIRIGKDYPLPMVDHATVKSRTLAAYSTGVPRSLPAGSS
jgi:deoxyribodipyrimidine photo-lyase